VVPFCSIVRLPERAEQSGDTSRVDYTIFRPDELEWIPRGDDDPRTLARLSDALTQSRANIWRYPPGARGKRHSDPVQEEVFVVLEGTLTIDLGEPPDRHEVARGGLVVVESGTILQLRNAGDEELVLFIYGAPPDKSQQAEFYPDVP
jgi:quercetin dioxygenase-like cupin family protein